ncbi:MAG: alpha/beta hydrolase [Pirellulales bacterium]
MTAGAGEDSPKKWRWPWFVARVIAVAYLVVVVWMMIFEESFVFLPTKYPDGNWRPPGLAFEDAWFAAADATRLHGWYVAHPRPKAVILWAHGNGGNLSYRDRAETLRRLHDQLGVSVMLFDYRGYGRSEGTPTEPGILDDARAARAWLAGKAGVRESEVVLFGDSLGGAVMVDLAAKDGARGLILENTFTALPDAAAYHFPWLPVRTLMRIRLDSLSKIADYHGPLLQLHGNADTLVPYELGQQLFAAANDPKQFVTIDGGNHNDERSPRFYEAVGAFLKRLEEVRSKE